MSVTASHDTSYDQESSSNQFISKLTESTQSSNYLDLSEIHDLSTSGPVNFKNSSILRKSSRIHKPPSYLSSYHYNTFSKSSYWCNLVLAPPISASCYIKEPKSYLEVVAGPLRVAVMQFRLRIITILGTWFQKLA